MLLITQKIVCNALKSKAPVADELDYLTTEFGAYFGPFIHSSLMKLRNAAAANVAASAPHHKTTLIHPQTVNNFQWFSSTEKNS
jgi:hypothetical protein